MKKDEPGNGNAQDADGPGTGDDGTGDDDGDKTGGENVAQSSSSSSSSRKKDTHKHEKQSHQSGLVSWLLPGSSQKSHKEAATHALQFADESRVMCIEQWQLRRSIHKTSKAAMRTLLDSFQEKEETRVAMFKVCLRYA